MYRYLNQHESAQTFMSYLYGITIKNLLVLHKNYASISKTGLKHHLFIARRLDVRVDCKNKNMSRCMFGLFNCQNDLEYT